MSIWRYVFGGPIAVTLALAVVPSGKAQSPPQPMVGDKMIALTFGEGLSETRQQFLLDRFALAVAEARNDGCETTEREKQQAGARRAIDPCIYVGWEVLPQTVTRASYGRHVADKFLAIDVAVMNRYGGRTAIIAKAFEFVHDEAFDPDNAQVVRREHVRLSLDPTVVRNSLVKGQMVGRRNVTLNVIKTVGLTATGLTPFFKATSAASTYKTLTNVFTSPIQQGYETVLPDTTVRYLEHWDADQIFKKGFIVQAGETLQGRIFVPYRVVFPEMKEGWKQAKKIDPVEAKVKLGELQILAQKAIINGEATGSSTEQNSPGDVSRDAAVSPEGTTP